MYDNKSSFNILMHSPPASDPAAVFRTYPWQNDDDDVERQRQYMQTCVNICQLCIMILNVISIRLNLVKAEYILRRHINKFGKIVGIDVPPACIACCDAKRGAFQLTHAPNNHQFF